MRIGANLTSHTMPIYGTDELALFLGNVPGSWTHKLIQLYAVASITDKRRLGVGFPSLVLIYETWGQDTDDSMPHRPATSGELEAALVDIYGPFWREQLDGAVPLFIPGDTSDGPAIPHQTERIEP